MFNENRYYHSKDKMLWKRTLENANSGREVIDTAGSLESGSEDLNGRNEIVSEAVVQVALFSDMCISYLSNWSGYRSRMLSDGCG